MFAHVKPFDRFPMWKNTNEFWIFSSTNDHQKSRFQVFFFYVIPNSRTNIFIHFRQWRKAKAPLGKKLLLFPFNSIHHIFLQLFNGENLSVFFFFNSFIEFTSTPFFQQKSVIFPALLSSHIFRIRYLCQILTYFFAQKTVWNGSSISYLLLLAFLSWLLSPFVFSSWVF